MMATDEDALLCDMAETYHVYDLESLPVLTIATLACGLRGNSRIMAKISGFSVPFDTFLLTSIYDSLRWLQWSKTKGATKGQPPARLAESMTIREKHKHDAVVFDSPEAFMAARAKFVTKEGTTDERNLETRN